METQINRDIGDEIISKLKNLIEILRRKNEKELPHTPEIGERDSSEAERKGAWRENNPSWTLQAEARCSF
jgi:hypothetical protein